MRTAAFFTLVGLAQAGLYVEERVYAKQCSPMDYGAKGDGKTDDTVAVQKAMNDCYNTTGGEVVLPTGKAFLCGPLDIVKQQNIALTFETGSILRISDDRASWPSGQDFLTGKSLDGFVMSGKGLIDGQGWVWWANRNDFRPRTFVAKGKKLLIKDVVIQNPPNHCLEIYTDYTEIDNVTVLAPPSTNVANESHNTDAIDVHGSPFYVHDCYLNTGDDNIAAHANDTLVQNCRFGSGHGASIGSLKGGWYRNITFDNIVFENTTTAIRIKTDNNASPGLVTDVTYSNLHMKNVETIIDITQFYQGTDQGDSKLFINGLTIKNVTATGTSKSAGDFLCQDASPCQNIHLSDISITGIVPMNFKCAKAHGTADNVVPDSCLAQ